MYISGVPGTGKTATVLEVVKGLREERVARKERGVASFRFIEVNGLKVSDPHQVYTWVYRELTGVRVGAKRACDALEHYFLKGGNGRDKDRDEFIVIMADELDLLCTTKQTILYHLFDWPNHAESNLIVIAIANAMDLPERVMMQRIASRLGLTRLTFQPYNFHQLHQIILSRLTGLDCFHDDAIQLVSRKVAAVSGDARRALDICRRAVLIAENRATDVQATGNALKPKEKSKPPKSVQVDPCQNFLVRVKDKFLVRVKDVQDALQEIFSSIKIVAIQSGTEQEHVILECIVKEFRSCGVEEAPFIQVYNHLHAHTAFDGLYTPTVEEAYEILLRLYELRLVLLDEYPLTGRVFLWVVFFRVGFFTGRVFFKSGVFFTVRLFFTGGSFLKRKIRLNVSTDDIDFALNSIED